VINIQATFRIPSLTLLITFTIEINIMRSRTRWADLSWNEGKIPIWLFVLQLLVSHSVVLQCMVTYFCRSFEDSETQAFPMFLIDPCSNCCKLSSIGYRVIWIIVFCLAQGKAWGRGSIWLFIIFVDSCIHRLYFKFGRILEMLIS